MSKDDERTDKPEAAPSEAPPSADKPRVRKIVKSGGTVERAPSSMPAVEAPAPTQKSAAAPAPAKPAPTAAAAGAPSAPGAAPPSAPATGAAGAPSTGTPAPSAKPEGRPPFGPFGSRPSRGPRPEGRGGPGGGRGRFGDRPRGPRRDDAGGRAMVGMRPKPGAENRAPLQPRERRDDDRPRGEPRGERRDRDRPAAAAPSPRPVPPPAPSRPAAPKPAPRHAAWLGAPVPKHGVTQPKAQKPALTAKEALSAKAKAAQSARPKQEAEREAEAKQVEALKPEWIAAGWDEAREAARQAGEAASALVDAWLTANNAAAIASLADADESIGPSRKAARRALNVLKAKGTAIPTRGPVVARFKDEGGETLEATLTPPDASGTSALSITSRDASGRYRIAEVIVREPIGILHAGGGWISGSQLKDGRARATEALGVSPVPVPLEWARWRIAAARELNARSKHVVPLGYDNCRELFEPVPAAEPPHPVGDLEAAVTSEKAWADAPGSAALHGEPEFRSWLPDRGALDELLQKLGARLGPEAAREPDKVDEALRAEIADATDRFFSPEVRAIVAGRMRDAAISIRARKGEAVATTVLGVARAVKEAGLITSPPREIPFLLAFFQKGVSYLVQQGGGSLRVPMAAAPPAPEP